MATIASNTSAVMLMSINVQSLNAHSLDITTDRVLSAVDLLALSETWMDNGTQAVLAEFDCITQEKRDETRAGGVAIYQNTAASTAAVSHAIDKLSASYDAMLGEADKYGDICAAEISVMGTRTLLFSLYISPGMTKTEFVFLIFIINSFLLQAPRSSKRNFSWRVIWSCTAKRPCQSS